MFKEIADPVHGLIRLDKVEAELLATKSLQRLHYVHQLGLAYLVFPGANYTRHAHSIGACHNAGRMLDAIKRNFTGDLDNLEDDFVKYRIIALLHDVGHYPFSHATEHVIEDYFKSGDADIGILQKAGIEGEIPPAPTESQYSDHEEMGAFIIENDPEISLVLKNNGFDPKEIADRFRMRNPDHGTFAGVISSDLDCDRLDYLRRTAANSGAPFGSVDINFLIDQATLDEGGNFCFKAKAARAADHLLISRFYDYMQVPFNKTAVALEWSLTECLRELFSRGLIDPSKSAMEKLVKNGEGWQTFDDQFVFSKFRELKETTESGDLLRDHLDAISCRRPAKMLASWDQLREKSDFHGCEASGQSNHYKTHAEVGKTLESLTTEFCKAEGVERDRLHVWQTKVKFTKDEPDGQVDVNDPAYFAEGVHLLNGTDNKAKRLFQRSDMLVNSLNEKYLSGLRVYFMPESGGDEHRVGEIRKRFLKHTNDHFEQPTLQ